MVANACVYQMQCQKQRDRERERERERETVCVCVRACVCVCARVRVCVCRRPCYQKVMARTPWPREKSCGWALIPNPKLSRKALMAVQGRIRDLKLAANNQSRAVRGSPCCFACWWSLSSCTAHGTLPCYPAQAVEQRGLHLGMGQPHPPRLGQDLVDVFGPQCMEPCDLHVRPGGCRCCPLF